RIANLSADQPTATVNGFRYQLNQANGFVGVRHLDGSHVQQARHSPPSTPASNRHTVPKGAVEAGAGTSTVDNGPSTVLLAAASGAAALTAGGLGFLYLRRRRISNLL
ncbi:hypothetical protein, partial [Streptomyces sp. NPDC051577]|uniref:hypothetical protein n=1 Tax=Streptomyces sp. NPDC051577 TaxID=3155166 RepID=UPI00343CDB8B